MLLKSPTDAPIHVALLSGHSIVIGPEPREAHERFIAPAIAAGAVAVEEPPKRTRRPKADTDSPSPELTDGGIDSNNDPAPSADDAL